MPKSILASVDKGQRSSFKVGGICGLLVVLLSLARVQVFAGSQNTLRSPLSEEQVLGLIAGGVANQRVMALIESRGIGFTPTAQYLDKLRSAGAGRALIEAIRKAALPETVKTPDNRHVSAAQLKLSELHTSLGLADLKKGDSNGAIAEFQEALRNNPENAQAHNNLGQAFEGRRELNAAINEYYQALKLDPDYTEARYNLAVALELEGDAQDAVTAFRQVAKQKPDDPLVHFGLATALERNGDSADALQEYRIASKLAPNNPAIREKYTALLARSGNNRNE